MRKVPVDKLTGLWFNDIRTYIKDIDGKTPSFERSNRGFTGLWYHGSAAQDKSKCGAVLRMLWDAYCGRRKKRVYWWKEQTSARR